MGLTKLEQYALIALGVLAAYTAVRGIKGTAADIAGGIVGGAIDAVGGAVSGAYDALPPLVKPSSDQNIIYQTVNKAVPGNAQGATLGTWLYDITH